MATWQIASLIGVEKRLSAKRLGSLLGILIAVLCSSTAILGGEEKKQPTEAEIKQLIDQLRSPNPKPITGDEDENEEPEYRLPPGFDKTKQEPIHAARSRLLKLGPVAFPYLIEKWGDKSYSITTSHGLSGYCHNQTVGDVCRAIICDQLQPYSYWPKTDDDPRGKPRRPRYPSAFLFSQKAAKEWIEKNKHKSLQEMQLEVLDWVIAEEAKRPADFTDKEREKLTSLRDCLAKDKKPLPPGNYDLVDIEQ